MVNPDADNITSGHSSDSVSIQRSFPASCHKHTIEKNRSVKNFCFHILFYSSI